MKKQNITLSQLGLYNPQRLPDSVVGQLFSVRTKLLDFILEKIKREKPDGVPQHYLVIGQRGMGKSMLLKRLEVELRNEEHRAAFIPLLLPEEQYNVINLARFWMNCLDALADTLECEKQTTDTARVDQEIKRLEIIGNTEDRAREAYAYLLTLTQSLGRRPVLLIDNMSLIFDRLVKEEQHTLRAWLMQNGAPVLVGTSVIPVEETYNYGAPFYDAFQLHYLQKLTFDEALTMIRNLGDLTGVDEVLADLGSRIARLRTLHQLTGGNPRTVVILFKLIVKGFSNDINDDLEAMLDEITPLYKARFEELPTQMQVMVDAIALHWDPATLENLREATGYGNNQLSPQLKRLTEVGWIEPVKAYKSKGNAYQISERFFNIWFLMRRSNRRQKRELYCLSKFLESFYGREIGNVARTHLSSRAEEPDHISYSLALSEAVHAKSLKKKLRDKSIRDLRELAGNNPEILNAFDIPDSEWIAQEVVVTKWGEIDKLFENLDFQEAEKQLVEILKVRKTNSFLRLLLYINLALCQYYLRKYEQAEKTFLQATEFYPDYPYSWNGLGNLYQDHFKKYDLAEECYKKAISLGLEVVGKMNLVFLYRDKMNRVEEAETIFNSIQDDIELTDTYWLHQSLFELYRNNAGSATEHLEKALAVIGIQFPMVTQDDWWRFAAVTIRLGYGRWLLEKLEAHGFDATLTPYHTAVAALTENDPDGYLLSRAVEIREPARIIMEYMKKYVI